MKVTNEVEPVMLFWGDEKQYLLNALDTYKEARINEIREIEAQGKRPLFTVEYVNQMTEQLKEKVAKLSQIKG